MSLLMLPPELRLQIYALLPEFRTTPNIHITIATGNVLTPPMMRTCRRLRYETTPLWAQNTWFRIEQQRLISYALNNWLNALGTTGLARLSKLNFSRHWELSRPTRGQNHVGFYVILKRDLTGLEAQVSRRWQMCVGTYPIAKDLSGMRLQSVQLLERSVIARLQRENVPADGSEDVNTTIEADGQEDFERADLEYVLSAMDVVARHPFSTFEPEEEEAKQRQLAAFEKMRDELAAL